MFALIDTNGATHIAIGIPSGCEGAAIPSLARMLEKNTTFICQSWKGIDIVKGKMSVIIGNTFSIPSLECELTIGEAPAGSVPEGLEPWTPQLLVNYRKTIEEKDSKIAKQGVKILSLEARVKDLEQTVSDQKARISSLEGMGEEEPEELS